MSDVTSIASSIMAMSQSRTQDQINLSLIKMKAQAEQAMADMIMQNARQVQVLSSSFGNVINVFA